jgi:SARP family transcriptional regulator, regulator of embCAB operon
MSWRPGHPGDPPARLQLFGGFALTLAGRDPDWTALRPRTRTTLRMLALHAGTPLHQEEIIAALWPDADLVAGKRSLQVAVSQLRSMLDGSRRRGEPSLLARADQAYLLTLPAGSEVDVHLFDAALAEAGHGVSSTAAAGTLEALRVALAVYRGDLLPEEGPAEWVVRERDHRRGQAMDAAVRLTRLQLEAELPDAAATAARQAIAIDRFRDEPWRLLAVALDRQGDRAGSAAARRGYASMLRELGVPAPAGQYL